MTTTNTDTTKPDARIIEKVQKLLALAESSNPNESAAAMGQAQRLMREHSIEMEQLGKPEEEIEECQDALYEAGRVLAWRSNIAMAACAANGVYLVHVGGSLKRRAKGGLGFTQRAIMVGRASDIAIARYLYHFCVAEIDRLTKRNAKGKGTRYVSSYRIGAQQALSKKIRGTAAEIDKEHATAITMVSRADMAKALYCKTNKITLRSSRYSLDSEGVKAGFKAGTAVEIRSGLNAGQQRPALGAGE